MKNIDQILSRLTHQPFEVNVEVDPSYAAQGVSLNDLKNYQQSFGGNVANAMRATGTALGDGAAAAGNVIGSGVLAADRAINAGMEKAGAFWNSGGLSAEGPQLVDTSGEDYDEARENATEMQKDVDAAKAAAKAGAETAGNAANHVVARGTGMIKNNTWSGNTEEDEAFQNATRQNVAHARAAEIGPPKPTFVQRVTSDVNGLTTAQKLGLAGGGLGLAGLGAGIAYAARRRKK